MEPEFFTKVQELRKYLHQYPELSGKEFNTSRFLADLFQELKKCTVTHVGETGLLVTFKSKNSKKRLLLRAELDGLPIRETSRLPYSSKNEGISHACGHDGHMAMLYGAGLWCNHHNLANLDVTLLFQPAEETGSGAREILENNYLPFVPDYCFAIHNIPGFQEGLVLLKEGYFSASVVSVEIGLTGKTSHAAEPEHGINPALAVSGIITKLDGLNNNDPGRQDFFISTPVFVRMGEPSYGTGSGSATLGFTFRCWDNQLLEDKKNEIAGILEHVTGEHALKLKYEWKDAFESNNNDRNAVRFIREAAYRSNLQTRELSDPFKWGEDFGYFTSRFPGAMIGLGSGTDHSALHNPDFDFPDKLLDQGIVLYQSIIEILENDGT